MEIIEELEEIEYMINNEELEEMEFSMNNEELEEMEFSINNEEMEEIEFKSSVPTRNKKELTNEQRLTIFHFLLKESNKGRLQKGSVLMEAQLFSISESTNLPFDVSSQKPTGVSPKPKKVDFSKIMEVPLRRRTSIRSMAESLNMPKSTVHRYVNK
ncbi:hypothetical protein MKX03_014836 [Papaver bracteatum]|nr:hypothetical protein MKX03_014836 [Papaver bracteatum]